MKSFKIKITLLMLAAFLTLPAFVHAEESSQAIVKGIKGEARFLRSGSTDWQALERGTVLSEGDALKTAIESQVTLTLVGASKTAEITVRPETEFVFKKFHFDGVSRVESTILDVQLGGVLVKAEKLVGESKFEVKTPTSIVGIRGTTFEVQVSKKK
jgi:hypothetical protein